MVSLFFSPQGRIAAGPFWLGIIVLTIISVVLSLGSVYGPQTPALSVVLLIITIALIYPRLCVFGKRFHDAGKSAWWFLVVVLVSFVLQAVISSVLMAPQFASLQDVQPGTPEFQAAVRQATQTIVLPATAANIVIALVIAFVVGMLPSDPGENRFGPPTSAAPPAAV